GGRGGGRFRPRRACAADEERLSRRLAAGGTARRAGGGGGRLCARRNRNGPGCLSGRSTRPVVSARHSAPREIFQSRAQLLRDTAKRQWSAPLAAQATSREIRDMGFPAA